MKVQTISEAVSPQSDRPVVRPPRMGCGICRGAVMIASLWACATLPTIASACGIDGVHTGLRVCPQAGHIICKLEIASSMTVGIISIKRLRWLNEGARKSMAEFVSGSYPAGFLVNCMWLAM